MNEQIRDEMILLQNIDNVDPDEQIKVLSICSSVLGCENYLKELKVILNPIFNQPEGFDIGAEFTRVVIQILNLNSKCSYIKKEVNSNRMKYVIYCVIYNYLVKDQLEYLDHQNIGNIRLLYCNAWDLISIDINTVKIKREAWCCNLFGGFGQIKI